MRSPMQVTQRALDIFLTALDLSPDEVEDFVRAACGTDEACRKEIEQLRQRFPAGAASQVLERLQQEWVKIVEPSGEPLAKEGDPQQALTIPLTGATGGPDEALGPGKADGLDDYEVRGFLGQGGMGRVLQAWQRSADRMVAPR